MLYQEKKSIEANKYEPPNVTLATTFYKPAGEEDPFVRFVYGPQKSSNTSKDKVQDQLTLIRLMQTKRSIINDANIITKTPENNT